MFLLDTNVVFEIRKMASGKADANVERWYAQFQSPTNKKSEKRTVNGLKVTLASVTGVFQKPKDPSQMSGPTEPAPHYGMLAAIVETAQGPWFFKAIGPKATLDAHAANFDTFVASFKQ